MNSAVLRHHAANDCESLKSSDKEDLGEIDTIQAPCLVYVPS